jgi:flavodoxin
MATLVVFDSFYGNTEIVARALAEVLAAAGPVRTLRVSEVEPGHLEGLALLVVGSPTRAFRPSPDIQAWLATLPSGRLQGVRVAAFDTRIDVDEIGNHLLRLLVRWFGYAAAPIERRLVRAGGTLAGPAEGFVVQDKTGPLRPRETDRARAWARSLLGG